MIDLHCHIIYNTDDGAKTIENSINILKEAYNAGFDEICFTPHYIYPQFTKTKFENLEKLEIIQKKIDEENIKIKLYLGNEIYISEDVIDLIEENKVSTIANSNYLLVELPIMFKINSAEEIIAQLMRKGYNVIIAHPERYLYVQENIEYLDRFIDNGVYLQGNYESIIGKYGRKSEKTIKKLLKQGKISLLSTDTHREKSTYCKMNKIFKKLKKYANGVYLEDITINNAKKIINNQAI